MRFFFCAAPSTAPHSTVHAPRAHISPTQQAWQHAKASIPLVPSRPIRAPYEANTASTRHAHGRTQSPHQAPTASARRAQSNDAHTERCKARPPQGKYDHTKRTQEATQRGLWRRVQCVFGRGPVRYGLRFIFSGLCLFVFLVLRRCPEFAPVYFCPVYFLLWF